MRIEHFFQLFITFGVRFYSKHIYENGFNMNNISPFSGLNFDRRSTRSLGKNNKISALLLGISFDWLSVIDNFLLLSSELVWASMFHSIGSLSDFKAQRKFMYFHLVKVNVIACLWLPLKHEINSLNKSFLRIKMISIINVVYKSMKMKTLTKINRNS